MNAYSFEISGEQCGETKEPPGCSYQKFSADDTEVLISNSHLSFKQLYLLFRGKHDQERIECEYFKYFDDDRIGEGIDDQLSQDTFEGETLQEFIIHYLYTNQEHYFSDLARRSYKRSIELLNSGNVFTTNTKITSATLARYFHVLYYTKVLNYTNRDIDELFGESQRRCYVRQNTITAEKDKAHFLRQAENLSITA
jgi:hypothetical protein